MLRVGTEVVYTCDKGYRFSDGSDTVRAVCHPTLEWELEKDCLCMRKSTFFYKVITIG